MAGRPQTDKGIFQNKCFLAICFLWWFLLVHLTWATMKSPCVLGICLNHHLFLIEECQNRSEVVLLGMEGTVRLVLLGIFWLEFLEPHRFSANKVVSAKGRLFYQKKCNLTKSSVAKCVSDQGNLPAKSIQTWLADQNSQLWPNGVVLSRCFCQDRLEFNQGDIGFAGGIQILEPAHLGMW